jgi:hypothetical protein
MAVTDNEIKPKLLTWENGTPTAMFGAQDGFVQFRC